MQHFAGSASVTMKCWSVELLHTMTGLDLKSHMNECLCWVRESCLGCVVLYVVVWERLSTVSQDQCEPTGIQIYSCMWKVCFLYMEGLYCKRVFPVSRLDIHNVLFLVYEVEITISSQQGNVDFMGWWRCSCTFVAQLPYIRKANCN